ncbi:MAG: adenine phosphoribosyltransferase [Pseudanabaena sp. M135S2SP2A07QC]|jgi:adenine phosphoribosyltransferase|nr:adenine phosphoribosyltransferase [Pseudanabaena sp. M090S1SP2A07QC]MCA6507026.1 adenine phosphoribosyltransferase [Pseudanabaena sp. M172S2SP2A07QC]MCA6523718.1 adenine phosphoribosyltransferase [Pseudanabaena sp. M051S1SP2A07QC]MCA6525272.1 adenine phosphoribosyltransferase [Pseudanabaena sp. M179S2SP2A07QC]MCA6531017.1 adenine phosphoribosyltransferase [Pseudanabaena sp. M125S2SP2A07QC]MCA6534346.1 adenine phosphoribosyltransferase [Pseudanabaena sp. M176S2SP2A07QC]MCA6537711.1 adenine 
MDFKSIIRDIPDFPQQGIMFRDITPLLAHPQGLTAVIQGFKTKIAELNIGEIDCIIGIESRGFILGASLAMALGCSFVPVRKPKKLPSAVFRVEYALEYGTDILEMHQDAIASGKRVMIIDDVIATGGTAAAASKLVEQSGAELVGYGFLIELDFLNGRKALPEVPIVSLVNY